MNSGLGSAYRNVRLALGDPDPPFCKTVSSALFPLGLLDVSTCHDGPRMREAASHTVDVIVCDSHLPELDFIAFVQDLRQGRIGTNPFVAVIATVRDEGEAKSEGIPRSGIDLMMTKPINPLMLVREINQLSRARQAFVVTAGYVGPTRRAERRNDGSDDASSVTIVNSLRAKVIEQKTADTIAAEIAVVKQGADREKAISGLRSVARMVRQVGSLQEKGAAVDDLRAVLFSLARMAKQVAEQHKSSGFVDQVPPIAERIATLATRAQNAASGPNKIEFSLLMQLSEATFAVFAPRGGETTLDTTAAVPEIVAVVDGYLARG